MRRQAINVLACLFALAGGLIVVWQLVELASDGRGAAAVSASPTPIATAVERLVPTLPSTPPTPLAWTPDTVAGLPPTPALPLDSAPTGAFWTRSPVQVHGSPSFPGAGTERATASSSSPTPEGSVIVSTAAVVATTVELTPAVIPGNRWRFGVVDRLGDLASYDLTGLNAGWFVSGIGAGWVPAGAELVTMIGVQGGDFWPDGDTLRELVAGSRGATWQVGNEPDVIWQSNSTPEEYAHAYYELYSLIKGVDPTAQVAAGAISQPTPLRLRYLDRVLDAYRRFYGVAMPVDVWAIHNSILREERGSWGVDIPPGLEAEVGRLYEIGDNDRLDFFQQQIIDFRTWMRDQGYRDRPLFLTELGVLMPADYGFPPERVAAFMTGAFDLMLSAADRQLGCPSDGDRLVQRWAWYSVAAVDYATGNLFDPQTKEMTVVGRAFAAYVATH